MGIMAKKQRIFISYRRQGGIDTARWLRDHLTARGYSVFMDLENLRSGNFNYALYNEIRNSDVFLIVLSNGSLDRCVYPDDWVRHELAFAIQCGIKIIPILKDDFWFPEYLPEDVDPIRYYNGLRVSYDFFDAFMNKLEEYITGKPVRRRSPVLPIVCICAVLLVGGFFLGRMLLDRDKDRPDDDPPGQSSMQSKDTKPKETTAPPTTNTPETTVPPTTNPPETTVPPTTEPEETIPPTVPYDPTMVGNSVTNLCNDPFLATLDDSRVVILVVLDLQWYNLIPSIDFSCTYSPNARKVTVKWNSDSQKSPKTPLQDVDCRYLFITTEWAYFALNEGNTETLYRATIDTEKGDFGQKQPIVKNILSQNRIAICGDYVYCWIQSEGLCRFQTDGSEKKLLLSSNGFSVPTTFQVTDGNVYFFEPASGIYSVSVNGGPVRHLLDTRNSGDVITHAVEENGFIYYTKKNASDPAEMWCVDTEGKNDFKLASLPEADMEPLALNISLSTLYLRVTQGEKTHLYTLAKNSNTFEFSRTYN